MLTSAPRIVQNMPNDRYLNKNLSSNKFCKLPARNKTSKLSELKYAETRISIHPYRIQFIKDSINNRSFNTLT